MMYCQLLAFLVMFSIARCDEGGTIHGRVKVGDLMTTYQRYHIRANSSHILGLDVARVNSIQASLIFGCELLLAIGSHIRCATKTSLLIEAGNPDVSGYADGYRKEALFSEVADLAQLSHRVVLISDKRNRCIRQLDKKTGQVSTFRCTDGNSTIYNPWQTFNQPSTLQYDRISNTVYLLDIDHGRSIISGLSLGSNISYVVPAQPIIENIIYDFLYEPSWFVSLQDDCLVKFTSSGSLHAYCQDSKHTALASTGEVYAMIADGGHITVYDEEEHDSFKLCDIEKDSQPFCYLINPTAIAIIGDYLYIGTSSIWPDPDGNLSANIYRIPFTILTEGELRSTTTVPTSTTQSADQDDSEDASEFTALIYISVGVFLLLSILCVVGVCIAYRMKWRTTAGENGSNNRTTSRDQGNSPPADVVLTNERPPAYEMVQQQQSASDEEALPSYRKLYGETLYL